jgi:MFS transporter, Spinster family, sphingosine-1-phosphate transporter
VKGKTFLLWTLTVVLAFNYMDRIALGVVLQDIKVDLRLSDTELGLLSGIAFALFYSALGVPIARWADRGNRVRIVSLSVLVWSIAVALCGAARSFVQLMLIRVAVGVGESGCVPASLSLIAGYFTREERPRAVSVYMQGISASFIVGFFATGWLDELLGWRVTFALIGLPGLALALLARCTIKDPARAATDFVSAEPPQQSFRDVCAFLCKNSTFCHLLYSIVVLWFFSYGTMQWTPAFFIRSFGLNTGEVGSWLAVVYGVMNAVGIYLGAEWATRFALRNERRQLIAMAIITTVSGLLGALVYIPATAPNFQVAFMWLALSTLTGSTINGVQFSVLQELVPARMQAVAVSIIYLVGNLVGLGIGPWAVGAISDQLRPWFADESLRYAMLLLCPANVWAAWHLAVSAKTVAKDVERAYGLGQDSRHARTICRPPNQSLLAGIASEGE